MHPSKSPAPSSPPSPIRRALTALPLTLALAPEAARSQFRDPAAAASSRLPFALRTPIACAQAALRVRQLDPMTAFYRRTLGLALIERTNTTATLGAGGVALLHLVAQPDAQPEGRHEAGLFHVAWLMPSRQDLGRWLRHAAAQRVAVSGASDHSVSEAIYLNDPEGNGIEVYSDRPHDRWQWRDGIVTMGSQALDIDAIVAEAGPGAAPWTEAPAAMRIGHMHLRVGDIARGRAFYQHALGLASTRGDNPQAAFLASGGYHHHLAINTWQSAGAGPRSRTTTGLDWFSLQVRDPATLKEQAGRLQRSGFTLREIAGGIEADDPWGSRVRLLLS